MLKRWKQLFATVPFEIEVVPAGEERYRRAGNIRESAVQKVITLGFHERQREPLGIRQGQLSPKR